MTQAIGAQGRITFVPETTWGVTPGSPTMKFIKAATYGESLGGTIEELISNSINANRAIDAMRGGNVDVRGAIPVELPILGIGTLLKHTLGTVVTTGAGPYTHVIKRGVLPVGMTIEKGFLDIGQYFRFNGCKPNSLSLSIASQGLVTGTMEVIGKGFDAFGTSLGAPAALVHAPYVQHEAVVLEGGGGANVLGMNLNLTNNLDPVRAIGSRYLVALTEGKGDVTGDISLMFENLTVFNKWLVETPTNLKVTFTSGTNSIAFDIPNVRYTGDAVPKMQSAQGVVVPLNFRGIYDATALSDLVITIVNTEVTI